MLAPDHILNRLTAAAAREDRSPHKTRHIALGTGASKTLALATKRTPRSRRPAHRRRSYLGGRRTGALRGALRTRTGTKKLILEPQGDDDHLVCEDGAIAALETFLKSSTKLNPIAVGSGSVNDIVKSASFALGRAYQVVPTAASMNGYTSSISAVLSRASSAPFRPTSPKPSSPTWTSSARAPCDEPGWLRRPALKALQPGRLAPQPYRQRGPLQRRSSRTTRPTLASHGGARRGRGRR